MLSTHDDSVYLYPICQTTKAVCMGEGWGQTRQVWPATRRLTFSRSVSIFEAKEADRQ